MLTKNRHIALVVIMALAISLAGCRSDVGYALKCAKGNRGEIEKVLEHFKDDPNTLKYKAARYLVENMPYHYHYSGKGMEQYDSVYMAMARVPYQFRDSVFKSMMPNVDLKDAKPVSDITALKSDYLIEAIDEAFEAWEKTPWHNEYDDSLFLDYVLPYRLTQEQPSRWRDTILREYPYLSTACIVSSRGQYREAEEGHLINCRETQLDAASQGKAVMLDSKGAAVSFTLSSPLAAKKLIWLRYASVSTAPEVSIIVNGHDVGTFRLDPTASMREERDSRKGIEVQLAKGLNTLTIEWGNGNIALDRIMVSAIESADSCYDHDFSDTLCRIRNNATGNYVTFDTLRNSLLLPVRLMPLNNSEDSCSMARFDYKGECCWTVSSFRRDSTDICLEVRYCSTVEGDPVSQYHYLEGNHQKWIFMPIGSGMYKIMSKDSGLFLEAKTTDESGEILVQMPFADRETQKWRVERCGENPIPNPRYPFGSPAAAAMKVFEVMNSFEWIAFKGSIPPKTTTFIEGKTGNCLGEASFTVSLCRYMGIPAAIDFTPNYANRSQGHSWSVIINPDGKSTLFHKGFVPGDSVYYLTNYVRPKVYRHRFRLNRKIAGDLAGEKEVPKLFRNADFIDVTEEYGDVSDVTRPVAGDAAGEIAYICVFDNAEWVPVDYGRIENGKVTFHSMGRDIVYVAAAFQEGRIRPFGNPFHIGMKGEVSEIVADETALQKMTVVRKYPFMSYNEDFNARLDGGRFQVSDNAAFANSATLYTHYGLTDGNWYDAEISDPGKYRYARYIGPAGSYSNINEIEFISADGKKLRGEIIGTRGIPGKESDKVFDGDILTGFEGSSPDGHWIGIRFDKPERIGRIRYIPRTDGNCIEVGDRYKLMYWHGSRWKTIKEVTASSNQLDFSNVPSDGLYLLKDLTKGSEERIFTYENGKQIWW